MNEEPTPACPWLASYEQALCGLERKGREKRHSPLQPPIEKREGKEIRPDSKGSGLSRARAYAYARETAASASIDTPAPSTLPPRASSAAAAATYAREQREQWRKHYRRQPLYFVHNRIPIAIFRLY